MKNCGIVDVWKMSLFDFKIDCHIFASYTAVMEEGKLSLFEINLSLRTTVRLPKAEQISLLNMCTVED